jgi:hypothetical protein
MTRFGSPAVMLPANRNGEYVEHAEAQRLLTLAARLLNNANHVFPHDETSKFLQSLRNEHGVDI